jgi:ABC-type multidrug transport system ATPase subunit
MPVLTVKNLAKNYGPLVALEGLDLTVKAGQVFGLLGPNGSGKTTLLGILLNVLHASAGSFTWFDGTEGDQVRRRIGAFLETPNFYPYLNADQNLSRGNIPVAAFTRSQMAWAAFTTLLSIFGLPTCFPAALSARSLRVCVPRSRHAQSQPRPSGCASGAVLRGMPAARRCLGRG